VTDNLAPGEEVEWSVDDLVSIFQDELLEKYYGVPKPEKVVTAKGEKPESKVATRARAKAERARVKAAVAERSARKAELNRMAAQTEAEAAAPAAEPAGQTS
jgi:hypothetical protein